MLNGKRSGRSTAGMINHFNLFDLLGNETQTRKIALQLGERVRWDWLTFWNEQICKLL